jgi:hypothetical protein
MKRWVALLVGIAIGIAVALYFFHYQLSQFTASPQKTVEQQNAAVSQALANQSTQTVAIIESNFARVQSPPPAEATPGSAARIIIPPAGEASPPEFSNVPPEIAVENMSRAIRQYGGLFGGNPVGDNADFTRQLSGQNPKHINFITTEAGIQVNGNGELVDPWGTPYFFHQLSGSDTEVRSAGPDKVMWTADDIVR